MNYKELNNAFKKINSWYEKKTKVLNIKTRPFNSSIVFSNIINKVLYDNGNILYVWCSTNKENIYRRRREYYNILLSEQQKNNIGDNIKFITIDSLNDIYDDYDLVIFDDITMFSEVSKESLRDAVGDVYWKSKKIIIYSCENVFPIGNKMELAYLLENVPIAEPRVLTTRIRLEDDIPLALYEYFKWFKHNEKRALIIVPSQEKLNKVYNHYYYALKDNSIRIIKYIKEQSFGFVEEILENYSDSVFIVTNSIGDYINCIDSLNIVILFANDKAYSYKDLLFLSGSLKITDKILPEILLVSKEISEDMDIAKDMVREFNKRLWERKLLKK